MLLAPTAALAEVPLSGTLRATHACSAYQSISRGTNPGAVTLDTGSTYQVVAANKTPPTHFSVVIPGASPSRRWVEIDCGTTDIAVGTTAPVRVDPGAEYILAVNWQPAFCETAPHVAECRTQQPDSFGATKFTLHGLWPQPREREYCGVAERDIWASRDGRWRELPMLDLTIAQRRELDEVMPGSLSGLDRHEWIKHGTCYGASQREYFAHALDLMRALNASEVADLFAGNIGKRVTLADIRAAFDRAFGQGAGDRVALDCEQDGNRTLITELRITLSGHISDPDDLGPLMLAAGPAAGGCRSGQVDGVGFR
ncbi:ribonuclease T2 family protein [Devosia lucknowensis]|nr:hypothetical protein [Devosia lucknowensis]